MLIILTVYFSKQSFIDVNLFHPFVPFDFKGIKNFFKSRANRIERDTSLGVIDKTTKGDSNV
jgi:hypothetical protein